MDENSPVGFNCVRVVYNCAGDWDNFKNYTAALTNLSDLKLGWKLIPNFQRAGQEEKKVKPPEFTSFEEALPEVNKWLIVTNNINAVDAHGEMSHVWLTTFYTKGSREGEGLVTFDEGNRKIIGLTHWKYA